MPFLLGFRVIAARLNGMIDFMELETTISHSGPGRSGLTTPTSVHKRMIPGKLELNHQTPCFVSGNMEVSESRFITEKRFKVKKDL